MALQWCQTKYAMTPTALTSLDPNPNVIFKFYSKGGTHSKWGQAPILPNKREDG